MLNCDWIHIFYNVSPREGDYDFAINMIPSCLCSVRSVFASVRSYDLSLSVSHM